MLGECVCCVLVVGVVWCVLVEVVLLVCEVV